MDVDARFRGLVDVHLVTDVTELRAEANTATRKVDGSRDATSNNYGDEDKERKRESEREMMMGGGKSQKADVDVF